MAFYQNVYYRLKSHFDVIYLDYYFARRVCRFCMRSYSIRSLDVCDVFQVGLFPKLRINGNLLAIGFNVIVEIYLQWCHQKLMISHPETRTPSNCVHKQISDISMASKEKSQKRQMGKSKSLCILQNNAFSISLCLLRLTDIHGISMGDTRCLRKLLIQFIFVCVVYVEHVCHIQNIKKHHIIHQALQFNINYSPIYFDRKAICHVEI